VFSKILGWRGLIFLFPLLIGHTTLALQPIADDDKVFLTILNKAYQASCNDIESLRDYYLSDAEIINDGRQMTLDEIIKELKQSTASLTGLVCIYEPKVRASRKTAQFAYIVVRETIRLSAHEMEEQEIQQLCTYVFSKKESGWKIVHDHCSSVPGLMV
jgi:ketosteroid isomerase-like protein